MRVKVEQLRAALQNKLAPVYLISGDEPLQAGEAADDIRRTAKQAGFTTRETISIDSGDEWPQLSLEADSYSIFSDKKLIDLRLPSGKPGVEGGKVLAAYCRRIPEDTVLLITAGKLEGSALKSQWFSALDSVGVIVQVWPLQGAELLRWLNQRAERVGLRLQPDAAKSLMSRIEGNLLAAAQEIEKLFILHGGGNITRAMVDDDVADSTRFDVFNLSESLLHGSLNRSVKILNGLRAEGVAAPVVLWALSRDARLLLNLKEELKHGGNAEAFFRKQHNIWDKQQQALRSAAARLKDRDLRNILLLGALADQQIKGQEPGNCWESLFNICLAFTGRA